MKESESIKPGNIENSKSDNLKSPSQDLTDGPACESFSSKSSDSILKEEWRIIKQNIKHEWKTKLKGELQATFSGIKRELSSLWNSEEKRGQTPSAFQIYKRKTLEAINKSRHGILGHLGAFLGVNVFLAYINFGMSTSSVPWSGVVALAWGIGLGSHLASYFPGRKTEKELLSLGDLINDGDTKTLKQYQKSRIGLWTHVASNLLVIALLVFINFLMPGTSLPWSLIPGLILGLGVLGHLARHPVQKKQFNIFWDRIREEARSVPLDGRLEHPGLAEARNLRVAILNQIEASQALSSPMGADLIPFLDVYIKQLADLVLIDDEIGVILKDFRETDMQMEEALLKQKLERQPSEVLRLEYNRSLFELEKQKKSFLDLYEQKELLELRINTGIKSLKTLQMDLIRMKGSGQGNSSLTNLKSRSDELNSYIEDYKKGLSEL